MPKKDYDARSITNLGRTEDTEEGEACPVCITSDNRLSKLVRHDNRTTYKKVPVDSEEGEKIARKHKIQGIPAIIDCKTYKQEDGSQKQRCRTIEGWDEEDWSDLTELAPKEEREQEKKERESEEERNVDKESGIELPEEPAEPSDIE